MNAVEPPGLHLPSPLTELHDDRVSAAGVPVLLKRDDLIQPELPGKVSQAEVQLAAARAEGAQCLLTFSSAYSIDIRAVAAAGNIFGFGTIGVTRGEEHLPLNPSLRFAPQPPAPTKS